MPDLHPFFQSALATSFLRGRRIQRTSRVCDELSAVCRLWETVYFGHGLFHLTYSGSTVGGTFDIHAKKESGVDPPYQFPRLTIGHWKLQVLLLDRFYPKFPVRTIPIRASHKAIEYGADPNHTFGLGSAHHDELVDSWLKDQPGEELLRSNIVEIEVVAG